MIMMTKRYFYEYRGLIHRIKTIDEMKKKQYMMLFYLLKMRLMSYSHIFYFIISMKKIDIIEGIML